jgi:hypothetical protein
MTRTFSAKVTRWKASALMWWLTSKSGVVGTVRPLHLVLIQQVAAGSRERATTI